MGKIKGLMRNIVSGVGGAVKKLGKRNTVIICSIVLIGGAIYLNWALFGAAAEADGQNYNVNRDFVLSDEELGTAKLVNSEIPEDVAAAEGEYFAMTVINRQRARDESLEVLNLILENDNSLEEAKSTAIKDIGTIAADMENEANIEALVISKGFEDCIAVINNGAANIIVKSEGLLPNELAQIKEIVYEQAGIEPVNIKIIEKT